MRVQGAIILTVAILVAEAWGFRGDSKRWHVNDIPVKYYFESSVPSGQKSPLGKHLITGQRLKIRIYPSKRPPAAQVQEFSSHLDTLMGQRVKRVFVSA